MSETRSMLDIVLDAIERGERPMLVWERPPDLELPPPSTPGHSAGGHGQGRQHGYVSTYIAGCRCDLCRAARSRDVRMKREARKVAP